MTLDPKKQEELNFARSLARALGEEWTIEPREEPDLLVHDSGGTFGLEVTEVFAGETNSRGGSKLKKSQADTQKIINKIRREYERVEPDIPLSVEFVGEVHESFTSLVVRALVDLELRDKSKLHRERCDVCQDERSLTLHIKRLPDDCNRDRLIRPDWYSIDESIGWRDDREEILQERIQEKSKRLEQYRRNLACVLEIDNSGLVDIRLLLVSNHYWAAGMIRPSTQVSYEFHGFNKVYFYPLPREPSELIPGM